MTINTYNFFLFSFICQCCFCNSIHKFYFLVLSNFSVDELKEGSDALRDVLEHDLPKLHKTKPKSVPLTASHVCDRCGRSLYGSQGKDA